jgi:protein SCO1/2
VEDRLTRHRGRYPGTTVIALAAIVAITAAWWALALWPAGSVQPEWLWRTRAACFGAAPGGLPDARGWILLIGEPVGMVGVLIAVWGRSLEADLHRLRADPVWRAVSSNLAIAAIIAFGLLAERVARGYEARGTAVESGAAVRTRLDVDPPDIKLIDQHGQRVSFADFRGQTVLLTFAFGHCTTVCPTIVSDLIAARRTHGRSDVRIVVVTLDPWRDTPDRLPYLAAHWELIPGDRVLSGSVAEVEAALAALGVGSERNETTGAIEHGATVILVNERGTLAWRLDGWWGDIGDLLARP